MKILLFVIVYVVLAIIAGGIFCVLEARSKRISVRRNVIMNMDEPITYFILGLLAPVLIPLGLVAKALKWFGDKFGRASFKVAKTIGNYMGDYL